MGIFRVGIFPGGVFLEPSETSVSLYMLIDIYKPDVSYKDDHQVSKILFSK